MATLLKRVSLRVLLSEEATTSTAETAADSSAEHESTESTAHEEFSELDSLVTYEVAILFLGFVIITVCWEFLIALMSWGTTKVSGRKPLWVNRIKDEILALGVITLVLIVVTDPLSRICIKGDPHFHVDTSTEHACPSGTRLLFTSHMIHETHYLLFAVAFTHIIYTCATLYLSLFRMARWYKWERSARDGVFVDIGPAHLVSCLGRNKVEHSVTMLYRAFHSTLNQQLYTLLRLFFRLRMDSVARDGEALAPTFNFLNILQQHMELCFSESAEHSWVLTTVMAVFLAIPRNLKGLFWLAGISGVSTWLASAKLQSIIVQLGATAYFDFHGAIEKYTEQQRKGFKRSGHMQSMKMFKSQPSGMQQQASQSLPPPSFIEEASTPGARARSMISEYSYAPSPKAGMSPKGGPPSTPGGKKAMARRKTLYHTLANASIMAKLPNAGSAPSVSGGSAVELQSLAGGSGNVRGVSAPGGAAVAEGYAEEQYWVPDQQYSAVTGRAIAEGFENGPEVTNDSWDALMAADVVHICRARNRALGRSKVMRTWYNPAVRGHVALPIRGVAMPESDHHQGMSHPTHAYVTPGPMPALQLVSRTAPRPVAESEEVRSLSPVRPDGRPVPTPGTLPPVPGDSAGSASGALSHRSSGTLTPAGATSARLAASPSGNGRESPLRKQPSVASSQLSRQPSTQVLPLRPLSGSTAPAPPPAVTPPATSDSDAGAGTSPTLTTQGPAQASTDGANPDGISSAAAAPVQQQQEVNTGAPTKFQPPKVHIAEDPAAAPSQPQLRKSGSQAAGPLPELKGSIKVRANQVAPEPAGHISAGGATEASTSGAAAGGGAESSKDQFPDFLPDHEEYRHRVALHLVDGDGPDRLKTDCTSLFWFKSPGFIMWIFQLCFMENALNLCLIGFSLYYDRAEFVHEQSVTAICFLVIWDLVLLVYSAWHLLPVYAIATTVATSQPRRLIKDLKRQKLVEEDEEETGKGVGGTLLGLCMHQGQVHEPHRLDSRQHSMLAELSFIHMLAAQAGVMTAKGGTQKGSHLQEGIFVEFSRHWLAAAHKWATRLVMMSHGAMGPNGSISMATELRVADEQAEIQHELPNWTVRVDLSRLRKTFDIIDSNHSGTISKWELAQVMRAMGTRATLEELKDMIAEVDRSGSNEIDFQEFCLFMVFKSYDTTQDGFLWTSDIARVLEGQGLVPGNLDKSELAEVMIDYVESHGSDARGRLELAEFMYFFAGVSFDHAAAEAGEEHSAASAHTEHHH